MKKNICLLLLAIFFTKIVLATFVPVFADEAYYYIWSLFPKLSYYDHPGMVSWLIYLGMTFLPIHHPLALRLMFVLLGTVTIYIWLLILKKKLLPESLWPYFLFFFVCNPLLGAGSILATPDVPLVFFWSLSYLFFLYFLDSQRPLWALSLGASLGLGFCSKYHIVLFVLAGLLYLIFSKKLKLIRLSSILLIIAGGLLFSLPVLIWNYQNDWVSFLFQIKHGFGRSYYKFDWTLSYLLGQMLILSPFVFLQLFSRKKSSADQIFSISQIFFFFTSTFKSVVEANWPIVGSPHALSHFVQSAERKKLNWTIYYWIGIYLLLIGFLFSPLKGALLDQQLTSTSIQELSPLAKKYERLYAPTYQIASLLSWESRRVIPKLSVFSRKDFFNELPQIQPQKGQVFYVLKEKSAGWTDVFSLARVEKIETFEKLELELFRVFYE